jgi:lysophospholipase L1-like esterase
MFQTDRRSFLKILAATLAALPVRNVIAANAAPYNLLVIGDSLIWGQGLLEKDKTYTHVAEWLRREAFGGERPVELKVKAHSGANIHLETKMSAKFRAAGKDESHSYPGEVNVSTPSMWKQSESAAEEYRAAGRPRGADLVLLTAGITDITVEGVLDPFGGRKKLVAEIEEVCRGRVGSLLGHIHAGHPHATIVLIGYFPMLSPYSSKSKVFNGWLETMRAPGFLQAMLNNGAVRPVLFRRIFNKVIKRSRLWVAESDRNFRLAVEAHNAKAGRPQAIFVPSPLTEQHAAEAPDTKLFRMRSDGSTTDPLYEQRGRDCKAALDELERTTGHKQSRRRCGYAAVGHPDAEGARMYAEAITAALGPVILRRG